MVRSVNTGQILRERNTKHLHSEISKEMEITQSAVTEKKVKMDWKYRDLLSAESSVLLKQRLRVRCDVFICLRLSKCG